MCNICITQSQKVYCSSEKQNKTKNKATKLPPPPQKNGGINVNVKHAALFSVKQTVYLNCSKKQH